MSRAVLSSPSAEMRLTHAAAWLASSTAPRVAIVAPSLEAAGEVARRALVASGRTASFGWERTTLAALATSLARPELARRGLVPAGALALEAIGARVVDREAARLVRFAKIAGRPGFPRALTRTIAELRLEGISDPRDEDLLRLLRGFAAELDAAALADRALVLALAAAAARRRPAAECGALLFLDVPLRSEAERDLVDALVMGAPGALAVVPEGETRARDLLERALGVACTRVATDGPESAVKRLHDCLFDRNAPLAPRDAPSSEVAILSAPGESRECVEIARAVLEEAASGTPFDRMAVLVRSPRYGAHLEEAFRRGKIPAFFARGTRQPDPSGRAFLALVACAAEGLSASRFAEYLSLGEVPKGAPDGAPPEAPPPGDRVAPPEDEELSALLGRSLAASDEAEDDVDVRPVSDEDEVAPHGTLRTPRHWQRLLVDAAVIGGLDRWKRRLDGLRAKLEQDHAAYLQKAEDTLAEGVKRDLDALRVLCGFALPLVAELDAWPQTAKWGAWLEHMRTLATRALRRPERVLAVLGELEPMARIGPVTLTEVRLVLEPRLSQLLVRATGRRYGRVFVATINEARGHAFDVVFVPGVAEKTFPQKVVEDPLLLDGARREVSRALTTNADRADEERLALRLAVGAARRRVVVSYPRLDVEQARPKTPSFYALEVLRVAEGAFRGFEYLRRKAAETSDARIGWPAPRDRTRAIDEAEYDLALLKSVLEKPADQVTGEARYLVDANPHLARALRFRWARWDRAFRSADGLVAPPAEARDALATHGLGNRSFSPTALQSFASCPYRFLLYAVHKLSPREEPTAIEDVDALTKGSLVHEVTYELLTRLRDEQMLPVTAATLERARALLDVVLAEVAARFHDELAPAIDRVWDDTIADIGADLREWLRRMTEDPDWTPAYFELSFGLKERRARDAHSHDEPVVLETGLRLRGSIDLVERRADGALRATDYKTGRPRAKSGETVIGRGEILQPVLYALTLEKLFPDAKVLGSQLYYCTSKADFARPWFELDDRARAAAALVTRAVSSSIDEGFLPAVPAKDACRFCDYTSVCGPYEETRSKIKAQTRDGKKRLALLGEIRGHE